jgi:hypothetical protein
MAIAPAAKRPLSDPKQISRLQLAQLTPLMPFQKRFKTHPADLLQHLCPTHPRPQIRQF